MKKDRFFIVFIAFLMYSRAYCQELNCQVIVNSDNIQSTERDIFIEMEKSFSQFLNTTKWTNDAFKVEEQINCNILITIEGTPSIGVYTASVQILSSRPVYNTDYQSVVFNFGDKEWEFKYQAFQPIRFNENAYIDNLSSLLAYYAYIIIGMDYDSFSESGGSPYFEKAFNIVNNAQSSNQKGWQPFNSTINRYWLINNLQNSQLTTIRKAIYTYHRLGLDLMSENKEEAENKTLEALSDIQKANRTLPRAILTVTFMNSKYDEIIKMFLESSLANRRRVYNLLINIDPRRTDKYKSLIE